MQAIIVIFLWTGIAVLIWGIFEFKNDFSRNRSFTIGGVGLFMIALGAVGTEAPHLLPILGAAFLIFVLYKTKDRFLLFLKDREKAREQRAREIEIKKEQERNPPGLPVDEIIRWIYMNCEVFKDKGNRGEFSWVDGIPAILEDAKSFYEIAEKRLKTYYYSDSPEGLEEYYQNEKKDNPLEWRFKIYTKSGQELYLRLIEARKKDEFSQIFADIRKKEWQERLRKEIKESGAIAYKKKMEEEAKENAAKAKDLKKKQKKIRKWMTDDE